MPDPRRAARVTDALGAILAMAVSAILANHLSVLAIAEWGARQPPTLRCWGSRTAAPPASRRCSACFGNGMATRWRRRSPHGVAIDGTAQRGRLRFAAAGCPVHARRAFYHDHGVVLAHEPIAAPVDADRGEAELTVAPALLDRIDWHGRGLTADALFCQRTVGQQGCAAGGDYPVLVKKHQGTLYRDSQRLFEPPPELATLPLPDQRRARTIATGHGRQHELRELLTTPNLTAYLDWPGLAQGFRRERTWREPGQAKRARHYGITSLSPQDGPPARLLARKRGHWTIENRRHRRQDVPFGEDTSLLHAGQGPTSMAPRRDAAVSVLHRAGGTRVAARLRTHSQHVRRDTVARAGCRAAAHP